MTRTNYILINVDTREKFPVYISDGRFYIKYKGRTYHTDKLMSYGFKMIKK